jgi:hypothetical protein
MIAHACTDQNFSKGPPIFWQGDWAPGYVTA